MAELKRHVTKTQRFQPYNQPRSGRLMGVAGRERRCFQCNQIGHMKRDGPIINKNQRTENDKTGPLGKVQQ